MWAKRAHRPSRRLDRGAVLPLVSEEPTVGSGGARSRPANLSSATPPGPSRWTSSSPPMLTRPRRTRRHFRIFPERILLKLSPDILAPGRSSGPLTFPLRSRSFASLCARRSPGLSAASISTLPLSARGVLAGFSSLVSSWDRYGTDPLRWLRYLGPVPRVTEF